MKTNKLLVIATIVLLLINLVLAYFLWDSKRGHKTKERKQERGDWVVRELNLNDSQKAEHKKIKEEHFAAIRPLFDSITLERRNLYNLLKDPGSNDSLVDLYVKKIGEHHALVSKFSFDHFQKLRAICNPEQQKKLDTMMQRIVERRVRREK